jgi:Homeodomain-like domain
MSANRDVVLAWGRAQRAASQAKAEREAVARNLAAAQADGASVRQLADLLGVQPTTVQRLIASVKS